MTKTKKLKVPILKLDPPLLLSLFSDSKKSWITCSVFSEESEERSQDSKPEFSEDEVTLIARMFRLVGERFVFSSTL